ncbi:MAG: isoprenyl transferase [Chitinophagaceae bacterium]|nr:MAG: isoprenyl transferase [Chitinophagaceae bacterium]
MSLKENIDLNQLPGHIAIIMDGNGRWAKGFGRTRLFGHRNGVKAVRQVTEGCAEIGVKYLTLYAFSTENWGRPKKEVSALMNLLIKTIKSEIKTLMKNDIRLRAIGDINTLPDQCAENLQLAIEETKNNKRMDLILALSYSSRWEIIKATKNIAENIEKGLIKAEEIDDNLFSEYLETKDIPDPELLIRTSGEKRISNFLLWQLAYAELYFTETMWPDFRKKDLYQAISEFQNRERRFGKTSEQLIKQA